MREKRGWFGRRHVPEQPTGEQVLNEAQLRRDTQQSISALNNGSSNTMLEYQMPVKKVIDKERVIEAARILKEYKTGKSNLDNKIIENEQWYKLRHWEQFDKKGHRKKQEVEPTSAWLFNVLANKHAEAMDNYPSPNVLPREEMDRNEAKTLTSIIPVILDQNGFKKTYSKVIHHKNRSGTGAYGIFWDAQASNGLGDIVVKPVDVLNMYWESGITDIQDSSNLFYIALQDNERLEQAYPQLKGRLSGSAIDTKEYIYDDTVDTSKKSVVVDWYYKKIVGTKTVLHYCKFVHDEVLFATENETNPITDDYGNVIKPPMSETGLYEHGKYPFVLDILYQMEGTPAGFGYIDIGKSPQEYIDKGNQAIMRNMLANARPRYFARAGAEVNVEEFADLNRDIVTVQGNLEGAIQPITANPLGNIYLEVVNNKVNELKEVTGNRDISTGGTTSGVTAASAIAAMQEAGSKLARDSNSTSYEAFREVCVFVIELIRQFYDTTRYFRINGSNGDYSFVEYSNVNIKPSHQGMDLGVDTGYRVPQFDLEVSAQKQSPYSKLSQNELALQFYQLGFFNPQMSDSALAALEMMDFDRKDFVIQRISQNGTMFQMLQQMQQQMLGMAVALDKLQGTNLAQGLMAQFSGGGQAMAQMGTPMANVEKTEALGGDNSGESSTTKKARERVAKSTSPT